MNMFKISIWFVALFSFFGLSAQTTPQEILQNLKTVELTVNISETAPNTYAVYANSSKTTCFFRDVTYKLNVQSFPQSLSAFTFDLGDGFVL